MKTVWQTVTGAIVLAMALPLMAANAGEAPLPPVETVLKRVAERSEKEDDNDRAFNRCYSYMRTRVTEYRNSKGDIKKREQKKGVSNPNVVPASYRPQPIVARMRSPKDAEENEAVTDTHSNVRGKAFERKDFSLNDDLLKRFQFTLAGREALTGRPALVLDFKPASRKLPERNFKDRFINKAAGRVWVDEADFALAKADLHLTEKVSVLGGLVGAVWKFNYSFDRERTADGFWFARDVNWHLEGREVFIRRTIDYHEERSDVRKAQSVRCAEIDAPQNQLHGWEPSVKVNLWRGAE